MTTRLRVLVVVLVAAASVVAAHSASKGPTKARLDKSVFSVGHGADEHFLVVRFAADGSAPSLYVVARGDQRLRFTPPLRPNDRVVLFKLAALEGCKEGGVCMKVGPECSPLGECVWPPPPPPGYVASKFPAFLSLVPGGEVILEKR
jgi:hypothetical protein